MKYNITPSKRLTDLLSTYLEFDEKQIKLGLWGGDLNIENVYLKQEAFSSLLNTWKGKDEVSGVDLTSFLTKDALLGEEPSAASTLNLKLHEGKIGHFRARVPWKKLLIGSSDSTVHLELHDVTIKLSLESCIAQALSHGKGERLRDYFCGGDKKEQQKLKHLRGEDSRWKQEMIRIAEQCLKDGQDIPTPEEFQQMRSEFFNNNDINAAHSEEEIKNVVEERTTTLLERFVKSFASSLGWRVGRGMKATLKNIHIVIEEGGIELGIFTEGIDLFEFSQENESMYDRNTLSAENDVFSSDIDPEGASLPDSSLSFTERREPIVCEGESIKKKLLISKCGVFLRPANYLSIQPSLGEYFIHPTNASVMICLRRQSDDKDSSMNIDLEAEVNSSDERCTETVAVTGAHDSIVSNEAPERKRPRRGKRDKRQKTNGSTSLDSVPKELEKVELDVKVCDRQVASIASSIESNIDVSQTVDENDQEPEIQSAQHNMEQECHRYDSCSSFVGSSALVLTKVEMEQIIIVPTSISITMMNEFLTSISILKGGRRCRKLVDRRGMEGMRDFERSRNRYISFSFLRGLRRRAMVINFLSEKGSRFNPSAARRLHNEYINMYRRVFFQSSGEYIADDTNATNDYIENLKVIEDVLPVEQILLYRNMAKGTSGTSTSRHRKVYVGDKLDIGRMERFMPDHLTLQKRVSFGSDSDDFSLPSHNQMIKMSSCSFAVSDRSNGSRPRHRLTRSFGINMNDVERKKIPKHVRRQTLNIDTMSQALSHIPSPRHKRKSTDLGSIMEDKSFDDGSFLFGASLLDTRRQFDSLIGQDSQCSKPVVSMERDGMKREISSPMPKVSITSSLSVEVGCVKVFLFQDINSADDNDSASIVTSNSFYSMDEINMSSDKDDDESILFFGKGHKLLAFGALSQIKCLSNKEVDQKMKNTTFSINGATCFLLDTNIFNSGKIRPIFIPNAVEIESVGLLPSFNIYEDVPSGVPFVDGSLSSITEEAQVTSVNLRLHFAHVKATVDFSTFGDLDVIRRSSGDGNNCLSVSKFDQVRWESTEQMMKKPSTSISINLYAKLMGLQLDVPVPSSSDLDCYFETSKDLSKYICFRLQSLVLKRNRLFDRNDAANSSFQSILRDFPSETYANTLLTLTGFDCCVGDDSFFDQPLHMEILLSQCRDRIASQRPERSLVLLISPTLISLSSSSIQTLASLSSVLQKTSSVETGNLHRSPRIAMLSDLCHMRIQVVLQSLNIGLESEIYPLQSLERSTHLPLVTVTMREILSDLLSLTVCFPPPFEYDSVSEAKVIATSRLNAMGLSREGAKDCVNFAVATCDERISSLELDERTRLQEDIAFDTLGFSPRKNKAEFEESGVRNVLGDLCSRTVEDAINFVSSKMSIDPKDAHWSKSLIINLPDGIHLEAEQYHYDWKISGSIDCLELKNGGGTSLLTVSPKYGTEDEDSHSSVPDQGELSGICFSLLQRDTDWDFGTGGVSQSDIVDDDIIEDASKRKCLQEIKASFGSMSLIFSDKDATNAMESVTLLRDSFYIESDMNPTDKVTPMQSHVESVSASFDFANAQLLICSDELQPFSKVVLGDVSLDTVSSATLTHSRKKLLVSLTSDTVDIFDLTPAGQCYNEVISNRLFREQSTECPLQLTMTLSTDSKNYPSEMLLVLNQVQVVFLRRFLNEILQFFISPDYGVGHFISVHSSNMDTGLEKVASHPLNYQVYLVDSTFILPKSSESDVLIALKSSKVVLSNSYEQQSWADPAVGDNGEGMNDTSDDELMEFHQTFSQSETISGDNDPLFGFGDLQSDSLVFDSSVAEASTFNKDSFLRFTVSAEDVQLFTAMPNMKEMGENHNKDLYYLTHFVDVGKVSDGVSVFKSIRDLRGDLFLKRKYLNELLSRKWESILLQPIQMEVYADFLPSNLRVLIKDRIVYEYGCEEHFPFDLKLRMSQFYSLLSMWYGNMQELPIMFPYDSSHVFNTVDVPPCPNTWPEYGTEEYVNHLRKSGNECMEIAVSISQLKWKCLFDHPGYFSKELGCSFMLDAMSENLSFESDSFALKVIFTTDRSMKVSYASKTFRIFDLRRAKTMFDKALIIPSTDTMKNRDYSKPPDMSWGLQRDMRSFNHDLHFPFQVSVFMTPDRWCLVNVGMSKCDSCSSDLAFFWMILEYFSAYFQHAEFGNPYFQAQENKEKFLKFCDKWKDPSSQEKEQNCLNIDVRLWLEQPNITIPSNSLDPNSEVLVLKSRCGGLFYRYKTIGYGYYSQDIIARDMEMLMVTESPLVSMKNLRDIKSTDRAARFLIERLDLDVNYETHIEANHVNVSVSVPPSDSGDIIRYGIESSSLQIDPLFLPAPVVCKTRFRPSRHMHSRTCDITVSPENMKLAIDLLYNFVGPYKVEEGNDLDSDNIEEGLDESESGLSFSVATNLSRTRLVICEPILGKHLPIAVVCIPDLVSAISRLNLGKSNIPGGTDFQASVETKLWIDYYKNGPTRSWEPFLEPYKCTVLYEKSMTRGQGISFNSECPLHVNISGAFLETLDFATGSLFNSIFKVLGKAGDIDPSISTEGDDVRVGSPKACRGTKMMREEVACTDGQRIQVIHENVSTLTSQDRVAFSLINMTGQKIRFHQQRMHERELRVHYLDHLDVTALAFPATHSIFRNLKVVEVSLEAFEDSDISSDQVDCSHFVDVQVPGMQWTRGISVDLTGKRFINLRPRSELVQSKIQNDWKLANALSLLADVSFFEGGRQITLTSSIEIVNKTCHKVQLAIHSDPTHITQNKKRRNFSDGYSHDEDVSSFECQVEEMIPGETYHIPILLLEAALTSEGCHLGSFWLRPHEQDEVEFLTSIQGHDFSHSSNPSIGFCSKPIQISHMVDESSELFRNPSHLAQQDQSDLSTGYQLSCPIIEHKEESASPFCYCVEVKRSPLVAPFAGHGLADSNVEPFEVCNAKPSTQGSMASPIGDQSANSSLKKSSSTFRQVSIEDFDSGTGFDSSIRHGPVAYSLVIHPPIVIENLLPEPAKYELMHATRNHVVWWSNLEPGESVPIHTVGLDSPLKLLINVGYCRTLVEEGAVVHHGSGNRNRCNQPSGGWSDVPKVAVRNADKVLNAISHIAYSKEARATAKIEEAKFSEIYQKKESERIILSPSQKNSDANIEKEETSPHAQEHGEHDKSSRDNVPIFNEVAREMSVIDSVGQRLTLRIDNKEGGGGQRHITVSCPYWIINTTEHTLRYKQEKKSSLVSGSMASASRDGSKPVDYSKRKSMYSEEYGKGTIFPGKPGALARIKQDVDLYGYTSLLNKDIPLDLMAKMAFMFNYSEYNPFGGQERMSIQLVDPLWRSSRCSEWSPGFSLQSVGVSQIVGMHCLDGRQLEVAITVQVAPGKLSNYTKIVRICPRYVLINQLLHPIRIWQDSSLVHPSKVLDDSKNITYHEREVPNWRYQSQGEEFSDLVLSKYDILFGSPSVLDIEPDIGMPPGTMAHKSALYITTAISNRLYPFHLPNTRADREFRLDFGPNFNLSASFPADTTGEYALKLTRVVDLRILKHVDNRGAPRYKVKLPPPDSSDEYMEHWDGELGVWFETVQWNNRTKIIVKGAKRGKFSYNNTDIHVGDELIAIDGTYVLGMTFAETMAKLKKRLSEISDAYKMRKYRSIKQSKKPRFLKRFDRISSKGDIESNNLPVDETQGVTLTLTFQTLEYRMKKVRDKALKRKYPTLRKKFKRTPHSDQEQNGISAPATLPGNVPESPQRVSRQDSKNQPSLNEIRDRQINVSLKLLNQSLFLFVNELKQDAPYRIENRCIRHIIYFRQRSCENYPWNALAPGESINYTWEEPMKQNKLIVRVGNQHSLSNRDRVGMKLLPFKLIETEDQGGFGASKAVKLDEVGFHDTLPCPSNSSASFVENDKAREITHLYCSVDADGSTRVLVVSDADTLDSHEWLAIMEKHRETLTKQIIEETAKLHLLKEAKAIKEENSKQKNISLSSSLPTVQEEELTMKASSGVQDSTDPHPDPRTSRFSTQIISEDELISIADRAENNIINHTHQLVVEVMEATGLQASNHSDVHSFCNPYCSVRVEDRSRKIRPNLFANTDKVQRTYYVERTSSPKWSGMKFVFDVPLRAAEDPTGFAISVKVKDFRIVGRNRPLGRTEIHLRSLRSQKEVMGWFPLLSKTARGNEFLNPAVAGRARGSVKLRIHWIYTVPALLDYYILLSERNVTELEGNRNGINEQSKRVYETEKARKRNADSAALKNIPLLTNTIKSGVDGRGSNEKYRSSEGNWASSVKKNMRPTKLRQFLTRQKPDNVVDSVPPEVISESPSFQNKIERYKSDNTLDVATSFDDVDPFYRGVRNSKPPHSKTSEGAFDDSLFPFSPTFVPRRGPTFSEGNVLRQNRNGLSDLAHDQHYGLLPEVGKEDLLVKDLYTSRILYNQMGKSFHQQHMRNILFTFGGVVTLGSPITDMVTSWVSAYTYFNDPDILPYYISLNRRKRKVHPPAVKTVEANEPIYPQLSLPSTAPSIVRERNGEFQSKLCSSRVLFNRAAQRSSTAVLNPGGWLKLRPITALSLPQGYTGMYVKVRYGSESCTTPTVDSKITPTWTDESDTDAGRSFLGEGFFTRQDHDLEVKVERLKTSGSLQLSVVGTRLNSKVELGVLQIPLANAINCCTEASVNQGGDSMVPGIYVRWFPLADPKSISGDDLESPQHMHIEETSDEFFSQYYMPCIKLAMWWEPDKPLNFSDSTEDKDEIQSTNAEDSSLISETYFQSSFDSISAALIDSFKAQELLSISTTDIDVRYSMNKAITQVCVTMGYLQVDHHGERALEPVVLSPTPVSNPQPTIQILAIKDNIRSKSNFDSFKHIAIALEEMDLRIEEIWMFDVWELFYRVLRRHNAMKQSLMKNSTGRKKTQPQMDTRIKHAGFTESDNNEIINDVINMMKSTFENACGNNQKEQSKQIYIEKLLLGAVKFNVSYIKSLRSNRILPLSREQYKKHRFPQRNKRRSSDTYSTASSYDRAEIFRRWSELGHDEDWSSTISQRAHNFPNIISAVFPAIKDAPIRVNAKVIENVFERFGEIVANLKHFYLKEMLYQVYKILGSVEIFGNPVMVVNSFMKGAHDFVVLPFREFLRSPNDPSRFGIGVAKGTLSLFSQTFSGIFGFISSISEAGGSAAAALSFDEQFKRWHNQQVTDHVRHMHGQFRPKGCQLVTSAVTRPIQDIVAGLLFAVSGVFVEPYKGAQLRGMTGFTKGVGIGTVGLVTKPLVGVCDALAHFSESIQDAARGVNVLDKRLPPVKKRRLPYVFGMQKILVSYNSVEACSSYLLHLFPMKEEKISEFKGEEILVLSEKLQLEPGVGMYIVVSTKRIALFVLRYDKSEPPLKRWEIRLSSSIQLVSSVDNYLHNGVVLRITSTPQQSSLRLSSPTSKAVSSGENDMGSSNENAFSKAFDSNHSHILNVLPSRIEENATPKDIARTNPVQNVFGAFGGTKTKKRDKVTYAVYGEFQHRAELTRIHNAISCLTGKFDSIFYSNGVGVPGHTEGYTSFGPLNFVEEKIQPNAPDISKRARLDSIPWVQSFRPEEVNKRKTWVYADELNECSQTPGPQWLKEARAQAFFHPLPLPPVPSPLNESSPEVLEVAHDLRKGFISFKDASEKMHELAKVAIINSTANTEESNFETEDNSMNRLNVIFNAHNGISPIAPSHDNIEDRLDNVESMLSRLLYDPRAISGVASINSQPQRNLQQLSPKRQGSSVVSALTGPGDHNLLGHPLSIQPSLLSENERLKQEVTLLRQQLESNGIANSVGDGSNATGTEKRKKKKRFKRPWKP